MRVAVTGSSGLIGTALQARLRAEGHEVVAMRRGASDDAEALWNPTDGWVRPDALDGVDAVVNLAGANLGERRWTDERRREFQRSYVDATRLLVDHVGTREQRPTVWVNASAVGYYGDRGDEELTEQSAKGEGYLADLVEAREREAQRAAELGLRTVLLRFGVVLSRERGALKKMLLPFRLGVGGPIGRGDRWMSWIALHDATSSVMHALQSELQGPVNACAPPVQNREFTKALGSALRRPTILPVPPLTLRLLYGEMAEETVLVSQRALPDLLVASGFRHEHTDIEGGLRAALGGSTAPA